MSSLPIRHSSDRERSAGFLARVSGLRYSSTGLHSGILGLHTIYETHTVAPLVAVYRDGYRDVGKAEQYLVDSSCKCTTFASLKDLYGRAVSMAFTGPIIQRPYDLCKALGAYQGEIAALGEVLAE